MIQYTYTAGPGRAQSTACLPAWLLLLRARSPVGLTAAHAAAELSKLRRKRTHAQVL
jgi:hypothetical protein